jgi:hypothetical protein
LWTSKRSVINCTWLQLSVSDWSIIMIAPSGLLLVVPTYMQFYCWGCKKKKKRAKRRHLILLSRVTYWAPMEMLLLLCACIISQLIVFFTLYYILVYPMQLFPLVHKFHTNHVVKNSSYVI